MSYLKGPTPASGSTLLLHTFRPGAASGPTGGSPHLDADRTACLTQARQTGWPPMVTKTLLGNLVQHLAGGSRRWLEAQMIGECRRDINRVDAPADVLGGNAVPGEYDGHVGVVFPG